MKALIVCALPHELDSDSKIIQRHSVLYTGIGKVNAISSVHTLFSGKRDQINCDYDIVINIGTCGGARKGRSYLVNKYIDSDLERFPLKDFVTSSIDAHDAIKVFKEFLSEDIVNGIAPCHTSDRFSEDIDPFYIYDMEAFPLAQYFSQRGIPFISIKYVSDSGSIEDWKEGLKEDSKAITATLERALLFFEDKEFYSR